MRRRGVVLICLFIASIPAHGQRPSISAEIVREMNLARQHPEVYAAYVEEMRAAFRGKVFYQAGKLPLQTREGLRGVEEAIRFLQRVSPVAPLELSRGLSQAAREHVIDQSGGGRGHRGSDRSNPAERMSRHGGWSGGWGENICYGRSSAREIVLALIIDDGLNSRKHRQNIFNPAFKFAGAAVGFHPRFRTVCSIEFAAGYSEKTPGEANPLVARN
jgi:uncharacterized protein YkwD